MLKALSFDELLFYFGILCILIFLIILIIRGLHRFRSASQASDTVTQKSWRLGGVVFALATAAMQAVGISASTLAFLNMTDAWRIVWTLNPPLDLNELVFPDLNGKWEGRILSNGPLHPGPFPDIAQRQTRNDCDKVFGIFDVSRFACLEVKASIVMSLFETDVTLTLGNITSHSKGVLLTRKKLQYHPQIMYLFEVEQSTVTDSDDRLYKGATVADITISDKMVLTGAYWTDRNWRSANNTAGLVKLTRVSR
jgi:hypothetical protein